MRVMRSVVASSSVTPLDMVVVEMKGVCVRCEWVYCREDVVCVCRVQMQGIECFVRDGDEKESMYVTNRLTERVPDLCWLRLIQFNREECGTGTPRPGNTRNFKVKGDRPYSAFLSPYHLPSPPRPGPLLLTMQRRSAPQLQQHLITEMCSLV